MADAVKADINDPAVVEEICARLAAGETTRAITRELRLEREFWARMQTDDAFVASISRARVAGQDAMTSETIDIADEATEDTANVSRLRIWARQWYASKLAPKKYGDKVTAEISGIDGGPVVIQVMRGKAPK